MFGKIVGLNRLSVLSATLTYAKTQILTFKFDIALTNLSTAFLDINGR